MGSNKPGQTSGGAWSELGQLSQDSGVRAEMENGIGSVIPCACNYNMWPWELWVGIFPHHMGWGTGKMRQKHEADVQIWADRECAPWLLLPSLWLSILEFSEPSLHSCSQFQCNNSTSLYIIFFVFFKQPKKKKNTSPHTLAKKFIRWGIT